MIALQYESAEPSAIVSERYIGTCPFHRAPTSKTEKTFGAMLPGGDIFIGSGKCFVASDGFLPACIHNYKWSVTTKSIVLLDLPEAYYESV